MDRSLFLALTFIASFQCLAQTPEPFEVRRAEPVFEELPELKASEILKPELLKGPHYVVRDPVPTSACMNQFTIDSDFGLFEADGNEMLLQRLKEIDTIGGIMLPGHQAQSVSPMPYKACREIWSKRACLCRSFRRSLHAVARRVGEARYDGAGSTRSWAAQVNITPGL